MGKQDGAQFLILHPSHADIMESLNSENDFYTKFERIAQNGCDLLENGRYAALIIGDVYVNSTLISLGFECKKRMEKVGFSHKATIVKNIAENEKLKGKNANLWRFRALSGDFYIFEHEYIFVMQKTENLN